MHPLRQRHFIAIAADPGVQLPVLDGIGTPDNFRERVVDPDQLLDRSRWDRPYGSECRPSTKAHSAAIRALMR